MKEEENKEDPEATTEKSFIILHTDDLRAEKSEKLIFEAFPPPPPPPPITDFYPPPKPSTQEEKTTTEAPAPKEPPPSEKKGDLLTSLFSLIFPSKPEKEEEEEAETITEKVTVFIPDETTTTERHYLPPPPDPTTAAPSTTTTSVPPAPVHVHHVIQPIHIPQHIPIPQPVQVHQPIASVLHHHLPQLPIELVGLQSLSLPLCTSSPVPTFQRCLPAAHLSQASIPLNTGLVRLPRNQPVEGTSLQQQPVVREKSSEFPKFKTNFKLTSFFSQHDQISGCLQ